MSNYNLKAKNKQTGEIVEFTYIHGIPRPYMSGYKSYSDIELNKFYEIIDDTSIEKEWREEFHIQFEDTKYLYKYDASMYDKLIDFISQVETEAYVRGQEEAYNKSADVARHNLVSSNNEKIVCEHIAQAIEQLASNKE